MTDEKLLLKIKKLLALSKKNDNEEEAASAAAMAQEILLRHNLSMEMVDGVQLDNREKVTQEYYSKHRDADARNVAGWKSYLAFVIAKANLCDLIREGRNLIWIGTPTNIEISQYLFETIAHDLQEMADDRWNQILTIRELEKIHGVNLFTLPSLRTVHGKSWKQGFFMGAIDTIKRRLNEGLNKLRTESAINALIVVHDADLMAYRESMFPHLRKGGSITNGASSGYKSGRAAGEEITFKTGVSSGGNLSTKLLKGY